jgi:hypothetical protein
LAIGKDDFVFVEVFFERDATDLIKLVGAEPFEKGNRR